MAVDFGKALSCVNDFSPDAKMVSGFRVVGEAIARRWITPRGRLIGYPNYGFDLTEYVNADVTDRDLAGLRAQASAEALKDERVQSCTVSTSLATDGVLTVTAEVGTAQGPFQLVVAVTSVTLDLLSIEEVA